MAQETCFGRTNLEIIFLTPLLLLYNWWNEERKLALALPLLILFFPISSVSHCLATLERPLLSYISQEELSFQHNKLIK